MTRLPGYSGACNVCFVDRDAQLGSNTHRVKSLMVVEGANPKLIVDGTFFIPLSGGSVLGWMY